LWSETRTALSGSSECAEGTSGNLAEARQENATRLDHCNEKRSGCVKDQRVKFLSMPSFTVESSKLQALGLPFGIKMRLMTALDKMSLVELEEFAAKLRHAIARNPENSRMEQIELDNVKQWIAIRQNRDEFEPEP
jgi:hypothetical protein